MAKVINGTDEFSPGTYEIKKLTIADSVDVKWLMVELNIYEDLMSPCMTGDITIVDTKNLVANEPIVEGDVVEVNLACNSDDKAQGSVDGGEIKAKFEIIKIMNRQKTKDNQQLYTLKFASAGWSNNVRSRISRAYKQKKYSEMVKDIFDSKFTGRFSGLTENIQEKDITIEDTDGTFNAIIPRWKPLTCFSWLAGRSTKGEACNFLFWEDKDAFHFESIEKLMKGDSVADYSVVIKNTNDTGASQYLAISDYEYMDTGEVLYYGLEGMFGNRMIMHDICNKKIFDFYPFGVEGDNMIMKEPFDYQDMFEELTHADDGAPLLDSDVTDTFSRSPGNARLTVIPSHFKQWNKTKTFEYEKWVRQRISQKATLRYLKLRVWAIGNFTRKVGQKIKFNIPSPEAGNESSKNDARLQGNYLISAIRHKFDQDKHVLCMELMKDNIKE